MIGGMYCSLPACVNSGCQITLKVKPEQSLSQYIGLSLLQQLWPYVHRGRATISYVFLCVYLSCCLYCALCALPPPMSLPSFHHRFGPSLIRYPTFRLRSFSRVDIWSGKAPCSWRFQEDRRTLETPWLANIVWAFSWVKLLRDGR